MSGICGIVRFDGTPVDHQLLARMAAYMAFRGPDAQDTWANGACGLGHTLLRTTFESEHERQPHSLDGQIWITADARIDGQEELRKKLQAQGRTVLTTANDCELILHAYHAWGDDCVKHLIGDFAFGIWDGPRQRLLCARDHFGVKPFFYTQIRQELIFSNTLKCIRVHPEVSDTLNDLAIADFLLFESNQDPGTTAFADIQRLPPAHTLVWSSEGLQVSRYWSLPTDLGVRYRAGGDYVEHFKVLLEQAVADRLRSNRVGVEMSGGLDSTAVAAVAKELLARQPGPCELRAHSVVYDRLIPDQERRFAGMVAEHLGIPIDFLVADDYGLYERQRNSEPGPPEPVHDPDAAMTRDFLDRAARHGCVILTGWDGDALLNESPKPFFRALLEEHRYLALLLGMVRYGLSQRRLIPLTVRGWFRSRAGDTADSQKAMPAWISRDLDQRLGLRARWDQVQSAQPTAHPIRPYAYRIFDLIAQWSNFFEPYDAATTLVPLEYRHPLMDLRLLDYCLSLPPLPWCIKKQILRTAMQGLLPDPVRLRPKTPLAGSPYLMRLQQPQARWIDDVQADPRLYRYMANAMIWREGVWLDSVHSWTNLRPLSLNFWLRNLSADAS